jgi:phosphoglycerate dehydrogenase-like enzyme
MCIVIFSFVQLAQAQISIEQLIEQTGIEASATATRDLPRWSGVDKILLQANVIDVDAAKLAYPDIEFVTVRSARDALAEAKDADAYIGGCDAAFIKDATNLLWMQRVAAGVENCVDIPKIASGEVILTNLQKMESPIIAEHAIAMMMSLARDLPRFVREMETGNWARSSRENMTSVVGKNLLVVGLGGIGTEVARFGNALGMHVSATRNSSRTGPSFVDYVGLSNELPELAAKADVIISAVPLTDSTTNLYNKAFFEGLKPNAIFINVGRGKSVVTNDLYEALKANKLAAAGLDVTAPEPLPSNHPLWTLPNVIITPHVSSGGSERERRAVLLQENLKRFIAGDALLNVVDPDKGY